VLFRSLFAAVILVAAVEPLRDLGGAVSWRPGSVGARTGTVLGTEQGRLAILLALLCGAGLTASGLATAAGAVMLAAAFVTLVLLYLSQAYLGYVTVDEQGVRTAHVNHHLHLPSLAALAVAGAAVVAAALDRDVTGWMAQALWGAVAAHYFTSGLTKLRTAGLRWPDRRLFPYYLALMSAYQVGNGGRFRETGVRRALLERPRAGLALLWTALLLELSTPLMLAGWPPRAVIAAGLVAFHLGNLVVLSVDFRENAMLVVLAGLPLP
jgi:hypothetical protein